MQGTLAWLVVAWASPHQFGTSQCRENDRYPRRQMIATDGQGGKREDTQRLFVVDGRNVPSSQMLGCVSVRSRNGAPSRKGCVVNGQKTKASNM